MTRSLRPILIWLVVAGCIGGPVYAHVSESALVLLLRTDMYIGFGVAAVVVTVALTLLVPPWVFLKLLPAAEVSVAGRLREGLPTLTSLAAFALLAGLLTLGFVGPHDPLENLLPLFIFTLWWICLPLLQAVFGDVWAWINPWSGLLRLLFRGRHPFHLPERLGYLPAMLTYLLVSLYALTDIAPEDPDRLAWMVGGYWLFTFVMAALFGPEWLRRGEGYSVFFRLIAWISPFTPGNFRLRFPGKGVSDAPVFGISLAVFSVSLLATGSFDGLNETFWWMGQIGINPLEFPGRSAVTVENRLGLIGAIVLLNVVFAICVWAGLMLIGKSGDFHRLYCRLAMTLLPIAVGYHLAHYLTPALVNLQYVAKALNDPMEAGLNLLWLKDFYVTTGFFNQHHTVEIIWLTQAFSIIIAHMIAVVLAHAIALQEFGTHKAAVYSQIPVALFMVFYTYFGLWLLASPLAL